MRPRRRIGALLTLLTLFAISGCRRPHRSVIWIVVDTLRADHLEWYGYERQTSPELAPWIAEGTLFDLAISPQPETTPAVASLLTGLYPPRHGVRSLSQRLHDDNRTAAEIFHDAGYDTAAFVSSFVMIQEFTNFAQGFDEYEDFVSDRELSRENFERSARETLALAERWVRARDPGKPFFLFVHLIEPHGPYTPPEPWASQFHSAETFEIPGKIAKYQRLPGLTDYASYLDRYDGEIACLFSSLGSFLRTLRDAGTLDRAMFALTADHGESLGERDRYFRHGDNVFQENVHVPLLLHLPESAPAERGRRVADVVSLVDLLPTALEFAGIGGPSGLDGRSLLGTGRRGPTAERAILAWSRPGGPYGFARFAGRSKSMLRSDVSPAVWESFDLGSDPAEGTAGEVSPELREAMARNYAAWNDHQTPFVVENNLMSQTLRADFVAERLRKRDQEDLERLRSLGYVN